MYLRYVYGHNVVGNRYIRIYYYYRHAEGIDRDREKFQRAQVVCVRAYTVLGPIYTYLGPIYTCAINRYRDCMLAGR